MEIRIINQEIYGKLCVIAGKDDDEEIGDVIISGDQNGLRTLGKVLIEFSNIDQSKSLNIPKYDSEHIHLDYGSIICENKVAKYRLIISRIDNKDGSIKDYYDGKNDSKREIQEYRNNE